MEKQKNCCRPAAGVLYGLIPHVFCIGFVVFSVAGATAATVVFRKLLLVPYFFSVLVAISFVFATISAAVYLKKNNCFCLAGIKDKWKYLTTLYAFTILANLLMFFVVFPLAANAGAAKAMSQNSQLADLSISVAIPCSGHASLIISELKKDEGVAAVKFILPNDFQIKYDSQKTSPQAIASLKVFKTYKATINNN